MPTYATTLVKRRSIPSRSIDAVAKAENEIWLLAATLTAAPNAVFEDECARRALWKLAVSGVAAEYLVMALSAISTLATVREKSGHADAWALPSGFSRKQLNGLPNRIEALAAQIEKINAHRLLAPDALHKIYLTKGLRRAAQIVSREPRIAPPYESSVSMSSLPNAMKAYATQLRRRIEQVSELRRGPAKGTESDFGLKEEVLKLIVTVKDVTGKYPWTDLANVLYPIVAKDRAWLQDADGLRSFYRQNKNLLVL